ncbi:RagB/SusD family nutrient uptake outer membrane protein [termite gut metagenome]|uniref:RagB/SusD family nutrient uptake outer membrane protein n=1 Tax=termite gut metagenome TaxID=433724 RepID=A0A5J4S830_9ZZZZ
MKINKLLYAVLFAAVVLLQGCQDLTEHPKATLTPDSYYSTPQELEGTIAAMYRVLCPDDAWGYIFNMPSYFGADDLSTHPASNKSSVREFDKLEGSSTNGNLNAFWNSSWKAIYQANAILLVIDNVTFSSETEKNGAAGQAYFMRALCYFYLVRTFGDIPVVTEETDVSEAPDRQTVASIYEQIIADLSQAETGLPESWAGQPGKPTRYAAKALLADVYLNMAGWPVNDQSKYALSATKSNEVIASGKYKLVPSYGDVFKTNNNEESIFGLQFNTAQGLARRTPGQFCIPDDEYSLAGEQGWHDFCTEVAFFQNAPKCERTDDTFLTTLKIRQRDRDNNWTDEFKLVAWDDLSTNTQHPWFKKFRYGVAPRGTTMGDGCEEDETKIFKMSPSVDKSLDIIRYATVLLNYAEASAMASAPTAASYDAINQVRHRAGLPDLSPGLSQTAFRDAVVYERAYECAAEVGIRWFDIVRLQLLPKIIAERVVGEWQKNQYWENSLNPTFTSGDKLQTRYLAPIPQDEMNRNKHWKQNAGY